MIVAGEVSGKRTYLPNYLGGNFGVLRNPNFSEIKYASKIRTKSFFAVFTIRGKSRRKHQVSEYQVGRWVGG